MSKFLLLILLALTLTVGANANEMPAEPSNIESKQEQAEPDFADLILKGMKHETEGKLTQAIEIYTQALALEPESLVAKIRRGVAYAKSNENKLAADDIYAALRSQPRTVSDFASSAWLRATAPIDEFRDGALAVAHAQRALKYSEAPEYYDALACAYAEMGNFQQARQTLQQAIKFFPQSDRVNSMKERLELFQKRKPYREDWKPQS